MTATVAGPRLRQRRLGYGRRHLLAVGLALALFPVGKAWPGEHPWAPFITPWFDDIGVAQGLPDPTTTALAQDRRGLVWIGTMGGLVRYDGYRMQVFAQSSQPGKGLTDGYVRALLALPDGGLLVGTNTGGLLRFDPASGRFQAYPDHVGNRPLNTIYALASDHAGGVWIATRNGLDHLDLRSRRITHVDTGKAAAPLDFSVFEDRSGNVWLGNDHGLFVRRAGTTRFVRPPRPPGVVGTVLDDEIWAIAQDREGRLWVGGVQTGAVYRDPQGRWHAIPGFSGYQGTARQPTVRTFLEVGRSMWIGTDGGGILAYAPGATSARWIEHDLSGASSLPGDTVRALMRDRSGNVWAATDLGVARFDPDAGPAATLRPSTGSATGLADGNVRSILVDHHGLVWVGMGEGRIDVLDLPHGVVRHLQLQGQQWRRDVWHLAESPDGSIWVGTTGIARIDPATGVIHNSVIPALDGKPVPSLWSNGRYLLIGTYEGVYRYDIRTHALSHFGHADGDPHSLAGDVVRQIVPVDGQLWYLTTHGVSIADSATQQDGFVNLRHRRGDPDSLPDDTVSAVVRGADGRLWVATDDGLGVIEHFRPGGPYRFRRIDLPRPGGDNIDSAVADEQGNLWLGLPNGVARVDARTDEVSYLGARDGLHLSSYIYASAARAQDGTLLLGSLSGLTLIRPDWRAHPDPVTPLAVTQAIEGGQPVPPGALPTPETTIRLKYKRDLQIDFALLDYRAPTSTVYSYRMDGLDDHWTSIPRGGLPSAIYNYLPHGSYTLQLRAVTQGMRTRTVETDLPVRVLPLWYERNWFNGLLVLALGGLVFGLVQLRLLYLKRQALRLQRQIDEHTHELQAANRQLAELASTDPLTGVHNRRSFLERAENVRRTAEAGHACMVLLDLDHFKKINDTHGHLAGDAVIRHATGSILQQCRQGDLVGRYGGEELVVCLPKTHLDEGLQFAERIRVAMAESSTSHGDAHIAVTASLGVAACRTGESLEQWLSRADDALYRAKDSGRNRSVGTA